MNWRRVIGAREEGVMRLAMLYVLCAFTQRDKKIHRLRTFKVVLT